MEIKCLLVSLQIDCEENCWSTSKNTLNSSLGHVTYQFCVCFQHLSDWYTVSLNIGSTCTMRLHLVFNFAYLFSLSLYYKRTSFLLGNSINQFVHFIMLCLRSRCSTKWVSGLHNYCPNSWKTWKGHTGNTTHDDEVRT